MRSLFVLAQVLAGPAVLVTPRGADGSGAGAGSGECGSTRPDPDHLALKLAPCASAAEDPEAAPSGSCCPAVRDVGRRHSPECLCALLLSDVVKHSGVDLEAVITIPKRCNIASRPVGYKCGGAYSFRSFVQQLVHCILLYYEFGGRKSERSVLVFILQSTRFPVCTIDGLRLCH
jgi:hypothetical protein